MRREGPKRIMMYANAKVNADAALDERDVCKLEKLGEYVVDRNDKSRW